MAQAIASTIGKIPLCERAFPSLALPKSSASLSFKTGRIHSVWVSRKPSSSKLQRLRNPFFLRASEQAVSEQESAETEEEATPETQAAPEGEPTTYPDLISRIKGIANENAESWASIEEEIKALVQSHAELDQKVGALTEEANLGKERFLRLNADFDNFRKRSEREKIAMASTVRGEVIEDLLPMVDNFERAKSALILQTDGEKKIDASYQGIYKQFVEIMRNLGVKAVETVGLEFDPLVHEAIMREESTEYPEGVIIQEFRKGFLIGEKLLRPAMVKVSSGPGPAPPSEPEAPPSETPSEVTSEPTGSGAENVPSE